MEKLRLDSTNLANTVDVNSGQQHNTETQSSHRSIFDRNPFHEFASKKINEMSNQNDFVELLRMREEALDFREQTEEKYINRMLKAVSKHPKSLEINVT
jgi:hypothetical protein